MDEIHTVQLGHTKGAMDFLLHLQLLEVGLHGLLEVMRAGAQEQ